MLGIVADDLTGSSDIGLLISKWNYSVIIHSFEHIDDLTEVKSDVLIIDTNSRFDPPEVAYEKVRKATRKLKELGCKQFQNKTCSVFRGNIGVEFDAMQDELEDYFSLVILGYPDAGRTTVDSLHYVYGVALSQSAFRNDPIHPMRQDDLVDILQQQTKRKVGAIDYRVIREGSEALRRQIEAVKEQYNYVILDVESNDSLQVIAEVAKDYPVLCGGASIGSFLPAHWPKKDRQDHLKDYELTGNLGTFIPNGSLMPQNFEQLQYIIDRGALKLTFHTERLFTPEEYEAEVARASEESILYLKQGYDVVLSTPYESDRIKATRENGRKYMGLDGIRSSERVSEALAEITYRVVRHLQLKKLIPTGGNTSNAICKRLGFSSFLIVDEIDQGLPSCLVQMETPLLLILKSGSFGKVDFFAKSLEYFKQFQHAPESTAAQDR